MPTSKKLSMADCIRDKETSERNTDKRCYLPTENEIADRCAQVRRTWDRSSEWSRRVEKSGTVEIMEVDSS